MLGNLINRFAKGIQAFTSEFSKSVPLASCYVIAYTNDARN